MFTCIAMSTHPTTRVSREPSASAMRSTLILSTCFYLLILPAWANPLAEQVLYGPAWTADPTRPWAEAIAIGDERILAVGDRASMSRWIGPDTAVVEVDRGIIVPGWIDAHVHLLSGGANLTSVQLRDAQTKEEFARRIANFASKIPPGTWITGGDWDHTQWGGELPDRAWIDAVTSHHPVWIQRLDGHMALANSAAMRVAPSLSGCSAKDFERTP